MTHRCLKYLSWSKEDLEANQARLEMEGKLNLSPWGFLKFTIRKVIATRIRFLAGDPDLQPKPLDELYTPQNFDRVFIEDPYAWRKMKYISWDFVKKRYLNQ